MSSAPNKRTKHQTNHNMFLPNTILLLFFSVFSASGFQRPPSIRRGIVASRSSRRILHVQPTTAKLPSRQLAETLTRKHVATGADEQETASTSTGTTLDPKRFTWATPLKVQQERNKVRRDLLATRRRAVTEREDEARDKQDQFFLMLAVVPSLLAFMSWEDISHTLAVFLDTYGAIGRAVDGGQFAVNLLRPTITGVVVPVISIALATLVSTTINVLRARQVELRALVNKESCELRLLRRAVFGMFGTRQHANRRAKALALLSGYVEQLERESNVGAVEALEELELSGGICVNELDRLAQMLHGVDGAAASRQGSVGVADGLIVSLNGHRSDRVALLLSVFPVIHWGVLIALSLSVFVTFLLVSNQQVLQYLNSVQLRALFAILAGVFSGTATLCLDLADPFRGSFSIAEASTQLGDLRLCLKEDVTEACAEAGEISSSLVHALLLGGSKERGIDSDLVSNKYSPATQSSGTHSSKPHVKEEKMDEEGGVSASNFKRGSGNGSSGDWGTSPRRYGLVSTLYFHLLTGPLGSNVRVLGDVIAWVATFVANRTRSLSQRIVALSAAMGRKSWRLRRRNATSDNT